MSVLPKPLESEDAFKIAALDVPQPRRVLTHGFRGMASVLVFLDGRFSEMPLMTESLCRAWVALVIRGQPTEFPSIRLTSVFQ